MSPEAGRLVLVVGPSGAGKDTLIEFARAALDGDPTVVFPRRLVTRAAGGGEDHDTISPDDFAALAALDAFTLAWSAHGLGYAIPASARDALTSGQTVVCNVSRAVIAEARRRYAKTTVVHVTAPPDVLAARLAARGRESAEDQAGRVRRAAAIGDFGPVDLEIVNTGPVAEGGAALLGMIRPEAATRLRETARRAQPAQV